MLKKTLLALCGAMTIMGSASAETNFGFENGTTDWQLFSQGSSTLQAVTGSADVQYYGDVSNVDPSQWTLLQSTITPVAGNSFGLINLNYTASTGSSTVGGTAHTALGFNNPISSTGFFYLRFISSDWFWTNLGIDDSVNLSFLDGSGATTASYTIKSSDSAAPDTGWLQYAVPTGTMAATLVISDAYDQFNELPTLAVDWSATAVPEPTSIAMMLAGLGALGFKSRRRQKQQAQA